MIEMVRKQLSKIRIWAIAKYRKPKLFLEFWTSANEKADLQISSLKGGNVPWADLQTRSNRVIMRLVLTGRITRAVNVVKGISW